MLKVSNKLKLKVLSRPEAVFHNESLGPGQLGQKVSPAAAHFPLHQVQPDILELHLSISWDTSLCWSLPFPHLGNNRRVEHLSRCDLSCVYLYLQEYTIQWMLCAASPPSRGWKKKMFWYCPDCLHYGCRTCFVLFLFFWLFFVCLFFSFYFFHFIFQYVCRLAQGWLELAGKKKLARATGVEDLVFTKNPPAKIEWLKNGVERRIERKILIKKKRRRNCVHDGKWSKHQLTQTLHQKVSRQLRSHSLDWRHAPGRFPTAGHLSNPTQLLCHVGFASPFTISLCPDQVRTICSTALISLQPKN